MAVRQSEKERRNAEVVKNVTTWLNTRDIDAFIDAISEDFVWQAEALLPFPGKVVGREAVRGGLNELYRVLPDVQQELDFMFVTEHNAVAVTPLRGTRTHGFMGLPPTNKAWTFSQCTLFVFDDRGKMTKNWLFWDRAYVLQQLGVLPRVGAFGPPPGAPIEWSAWLKRVPGMGPQRAPAGIGAPPPQSPETVTDLVREVMQFPLQAFARSMELVLKQGGDGDLRNPSRGGVGSPWEKETPRPWYQNRSRNDDR